MSLLGQFCRARCKVFLSPDNTVKAFTKTSLIIRDVARGSPGMGLVLPFARITRGLAYVDFIFADIVPHPSGSPVDKGVRPSRASTASSSSGSRRSFPAVLQGVRADERRMEAREAAEARSASKAERGTRSREAKERSAPSTPAERAEVRSMSKSDRGGRSRETQEPNPSATPAERAEARSTNKSERGAQSREIQAQNASATQAERPSASPSEETIQDGSRSGNDGKRAVDDSRNAPEATAQPSSVGNDSQAQASMPFASLVLPHVLAHVNDQTNVPTEGEEDSSDGESVSEQEAEADGGSSRSSLLVPKAMNASLTAPHPTEGHSPAGHERNATSDLPAHGSDVPVIGTGGDSHRAQVVKPGSHMSADDADPEMTHRLESRTGPLESPSGSVLLQPETIVRRVSSASLGVELPDGKPETAKTDPVLRDGGVSDRSAPAQMNWYTQSLRDAQDSGVRAPWGGQQGQRASVDGAEGFSELWGEQLSAQRDQAETKLPQATVIDRQVSSGPATESMIAGAHGRVISSPPPPPPTPPSVSPAPSSMPAQDATESSVRFMTRSVVFDVAQPDLGHVNVRVAMTNDMVHTYFSTERLEVGQFLANGQDRLQAAFQANGLDMGQFRVDIDRQSAGRSFQQDSSQEQGHTWNQGSQGMKWGQSPEGQDEPRTSRHGLLNVVA